MSKRNLPYLHEKKVLVRQGQQLWHLHQALRDHDEVTVVTELARQYKEVGRVSTLSEGLVLAGAVVTAYRSTEAGERVVQRARERLDARACYSSTTNLINA